MDGDGTVWAWGDNSKGQLGDGTTAGRLSPVQVHDLADVVAVTAGVSTSAALSSDGTVWTWGANQVGQLGDGSHTDRWSPLPVAGLTAASAVSAGWNHVLVLARDGTVWSWGFNSSGQLGDGSFKNRSLPEPVPGLSDVVAIAAGGGHSLALLGDGTVLAWGSDIWGQLGDGNAADSPHPVPVAALHDVHVQAIAAGGGHSVALTGDGTVWAWGWNTSGQLGDGTFLVRRTPVETLGLPPATEIVAGYYHTFAFGIDGTVWAWGQNLKGQLGDGTIVAGREIPVPLPDLTNVIAIAAGGAHNVALNADDSLLAWGFNVKGQVGDGTTSDRAQPIAVSGPGFQWMAGTPIFQPTGGTYGAPQSVILRSSTPDAVISYTIDGSEPIESDPMVASGEAVLVDRSLTLTARAWAADLLPSNLAAEEYALKVATPSILPGGGLYAAPQQVVLSTATPEATVHYTTDGSAPTIDSPEFTAPLTIDAATVLTAKAFRDGWNESEAATAGYSFDFGALAPPAFTPAGGTYVTAVDVELTAAHGAAIYYTTDGSDPTPTGDLFIGPITLTATTTVKAAAFHPDWAPSAVVEETYEIEVASPVFEPPGGTYAGSLEVAVTTKTPGATVAYTTDGSEPSESSPVLAAGETVLIEASLTLRARAFRPGLVSSDVVSADYVISSDSIDEAVAAGARHLLIARRDGSILAWGENEAGQLGNGGFQPAAEPTPASLSDAVAVAAGGAHSLALRQDQTVWAWGANDAGQLGDGTTQSSPLPVQVQRLSDVIALAAGQAHSLALDENGTVWAWGANGSGQLGNGGTSDSAAPVPVEGLEDIVQIAVGRDHNLARKEDGTLWTWGGNEHGQIGDGTQDDRQLPVELDLPGPMIAVVAGDDHSLAVAEDGMLWGWGDNRASQLGGRNQFSEGEEPQGSAGGGPQLSPVALGLTNCGFDFSALENARAIEGGRQHSLMLNDSALTSLGGETASDCDQLHRGVGLASPSVVRLSAAGDRNLAVTADGTIWYWEQGPGGPLQPIALTLPSGELRTFPPLFSVPPGTYREEKMVVVTATTPGSVIHYTTDESVPDEASPVIASGAGIPITRTTPLQAIAFAAGRPPSSVSFAWYSLKVMDPVLTPPPDSYDLPVEVSVTVATPGAIIVYDIDGGDPEPLSPGTRIPVTPPATLRVAASREGWGSSEVIGPYTVGATRPVITPPGGSFTEPVTVTVTTMTLGTTLRYTTDGTEPNFNHTALLSGATLRIDRSLTLTVRAFRDDLPASGTAAATFRFALPAPTLHVTREEEGNGPFYLTAAASVAGGLVRCTFDGSEPTVVSTICSRPLPIDDDVTVKARAFLVGWEPSPTVTRSWSIDEAAVAAPTLSLAAGRYPSRRRVEIDSTTPSAVVRYTTDGTDPGPADPVVPAAGVLVDRSLILKARAYLGGRRSLLAREDYLLTGAVNAGDTVVTLATDGSVWAWGADGAGQVGDGLPWFHPVPSPVLVAIDSVLAIASGDRHTVALREDGTVWTWGANDQGQLGDGTQIGSPMPIPIDLTDVVAVGASKDFSVAVKRGGTLWLWGAAAFQPDPAFTPRQVPGAECLRLFTGGGRLACVDPAGKTWMAYPYQPFQERPDLAGLAGAAGDRDFVPLFTDGGRHGAVGSDFQRVARPDLPPLTDMANDVMLAARAIPWAQRQPLPSADLRFMVSQASPAAAVGNASVIAADGQLWRWGANEYGQVGDGTRIRRQAPFAVPGLELLDDPWLLDDSDGDGLRNVEELDLGTDPWEADTNSDGISDGISVGLGRDPVSVDLDGDAVSNTDERAQGTDPLVADTDGDGVADGTDAFPLDPDRWERPPPDPGDTSPPDINLTEPRNAVLVSTVP